MKKEKFEVPIELDAKILQYAAEKKFTAMHWYRTLPARAAAVILIGAIIGSLQFASRENKEKYIPQTAENFPAENLNWNDFEERMEYVANEIADEAVYLAQI